MKCQKEDWNVNGHEFECRKAEEANAQSSRAVSRFRFLSEAKADWTIYYVRVSRLWFDDIHPSGPHLKIEQTFSNIARNLRLSRSGMAYFDQMYAEGVTDQIEQM